MATEGVPPWLSTWLDSLLKPRRTSDGRRLLLLTATPTALVLGYALLRHLHHQGAFSSAVGA